MAATSILCWKESALPGAAPFAAKYSTLYFAAQSKCAGALPLDPLPAFAGLCYTGSAALLHPSNGKEVSVMDGVITFLVSVVASVVAYYVCKWLDGHGKGQ